MIAGMTVLAVIPARGGSKGLPRKNLAELGGKPLIAWTIEAALSSSFVDRVVVSSDSQEIIDVARELGADVPFVRPSHLARDDTPTWDTLVHALEQVPSFDLVVLLQPTSPLRTTADIDAATQMSVERGSPVVGVSVASKPPEWLYYASEQGTLEPVLPRQSAVRRRQEARPALAINGAIYVASAQRLLDNKGFIGPDTLAYEMPAHRSVDIDNELDLSLAALIFASRI